MKAVESQWMMLLGQQNKLYLTPPPNLFILIAFLEKIKPALKYLHAEFSQ